MGGAGQRIAGQRWPKRTLDLGLKVPSSAGGQHGDLQASLEGHRGEDEMLG